jgi:phosphoglycerol transferase MdoB-like AlkP superfamily enzyme
VVNLIVAKIDRSGQEIKSRTSLSLNGISGLITQQWGRKMLSNNFTEIIPYHKYGQTAGGWRDGMVAGEHLPRLVDSSMKPGRR